MFTYPQKWHFPQQGYTKRQHIYILSFRNKSFITQQKKIKDYERLRSLKIKIYIYLFDLPAKVTVFPAADLGMSETPTLSLS